jgi:hypothetical protein
MTEWGYGSHSAQETQKLARLAHRAGAYGGYLAELSALGTNGDNPQNCSTELMALIRKVLGTAVLPIYVALVPFFVAKSETGKPEPELCSCGLLMPHVWFWFLYKHYRTEFFLRFGGCTEPQAATKLKRFWQSFHVNDPRRLPCFSEPGFEDTTFPIGVHGDAVPCTKKDSLDVLSFFSLMGMGATAQICFFMFGMFSKCRVDIAVLGEFLLWDDGTSNDAAWAILIWSFKSLEAGVHPLTDHRGEAFTTEPWISLAGTSLANGLKAVLVNFRADAEYTYVHCDLPGHWSSHNPCHTCHADSNSAKGGPNHYLTFGPTATWPHSIFVDMVDFATFCSEKAKPMHPLLRPRATGGLGLHVFVFMRDSLHCLDIGVSMLITGSTLWLLAYGNYVHAADPQAAMRDICADILELYVLEKTSSRFTNLELNMFIDPENPTNSPPLLHGKGAEIRHLVPILHLVWRKYADATSDHDKHVDLCLSSLSDIYSLLGWKTETGEVPLFLSSAAPDELRQLIDIFLVENTFLEQLAMSRAPPLLLWHRVSKHHSVWHMGFESQFQHPSSARTYMNEDVMQVMKKVGMANRYAVPTHRRSLTIAERVCLGKSIQLFTDDAR